ncbi:MAG: tetratricopeptide repeat protein [Deltaproteobacteria bacterium]|jgi:tetratricopeptide (TPR) repeat protein|nr:tetratricopeptide repeat protein [Deltaproteobacteria bacterium]
MSAQKETANSGLLGRVVLALMFASLLGMFAASFAYRHSNPSLVKHLNAVSESSSESEEAAEAQAMQHIGELMGKLKENPESYDLRMELAGHFMESNQWPNAVAHLEKAVEIRPDSLPAHMHLGYARFSLQEYEAAAQSYERAVELSGDANAKVNLAFIYKNHLNRQQEADALFDAVINSDANEQAREMAKAIKAQ